MADWLEIKTEYVTGDLSLQKLSQKYGVAQSTIRKRSANEHWVEQREEHRNNVGTLTAQKSAEKIAETEAEISAVKSRARLKIWAEIERRILDPSQEMDGADFRRMVQNYCDMLGAEPKDTGDTDALKKAKELLEGIPSAID